MASDYLKEYKRLSVPLLQQIAEQGAMPMGGQADLTPIKNRAREAVEALNDAQRACDAGRTEDAMEAMRRARSVIDIALGASLGTHGAAMPSGAGGAAGSGGYGRY